MKFRKAITLVAALCAVLMIGSTAMAANNVTANVTSESIQQGSICSKAGGFSLRFDKATVLMGGDRIEAKLPLGVTICTKGGFDLELSAGNSRGFVPTDGSTAGGAPGFLTGSSTSPAFFSEDASGTMVGAAGGKIVGEVLFRITGSEGGQFVFVDVIGNTGADNITVGTDAGDTFTLLFFDQKTNPINYGQATGYPGVAGIYVDDTVLAGKQYTVAATIAQNTLCINVASPTFTATVVNASMDSKDDKFTFVPSNPQIADIVNPQTIVQYVCKGQTPPNINLVSRAEQQNCESWFDADWFDEDNICGMNGIDVILKNATTPFGLENYAVQLDILVNGNTGNNGVYWGSTMLSTNGYTDGVDACNGSNDVYGQIDQVLDSAGKNVTDPLGYDKNCDVKARALTLKYLPSTLGVASNNSAIWFNIPRMVYDLDDVKAGDVVTVRITLSLPPCKTIGVVDVKWGTFGCALSATSSALTFPYFTALQSTDWWNGMAISNIGGNAGTFTATVYEQDGDVGTFTSPTIAAKSQWVGLLSAVSFTKTAGAGTLGDSSCFIIVNAKFQADGFAMLSSLANSAVDGSESMGYLPRTDAPYFSTLKP